jgi:diaminohydroxyphosphoribosylaminopyrimidine deaminase/5-amino-6-(5-phosphoribosylamino)uracil reductase
VILKSAVSADGYVGQRSGRVPLTGDVANRHFHRQRAEIGAIAVGAGTILIDDPDLTPRGAYRHLPLTRIVFDWRGRVSPSARVFATRDAGPIILVTQAEACAANPAHFEALADAGAAVEVFETRNLRDVLGRVAMREILSVLVEGGPTLHAAFADAGLVDRVQWVVTSHGLGTGVPAASAISPDVLADGRATVVQLGADRLIEFDVHRTDRGDRAHRAH